MRPRALLALVLTATLLAGCGGGGDDTASQAADTSAGSAAVPASAESLDSSAGGGSLGKGVDVQARVPALGRVIVRTASLTVTVDDVRTASERAADVAAGAGGGLEAEEGDAENARLRLRVAPDRLDAVLGQLAGLGEERSRTVGSEDVTEQVADLDARLTTQRTSVDRVRALLDRATSIADVVALETELSRREADLESLQARLRTVEGQADLATVDLQLETEQGAAAVPGFLGGVDAGWDAFLASARVLAAVAGALLPFVPVVLLALGVAQLLRRRRRAPLPAPPLAPPPASAA